MSRKFPEKFRFGAATAAYQIEGAAREDGRTDSIWDAFARVPGAVIDGHDGAVACDHYHRYADDVQLMSDLGLQTYRFSTSWSRVCPDGGPANQAGIDFYQRLVDSLLEKNIAPWLTLYHWDLPQALEEQGGWTNRDVVERFADYAQVVGEALGDRVPTWTTLNEPWCSSFLSYTAGAHAPGRMSKRDGLVAGHHLLLSHGRGIQVLRELVPNADLGITLNQTVADPLDPQDPRDVDAARRIDGQFNRFFLDPIFRGEYPADLLEDVAEFGFTDVIHDGDLALIQQPIDVLGVNYYHGEAVSYREPAVPLLQDAPTDRPVQSPYPAADGVYSHPRGLATTSMGWEIQPDGLTRLLQSLHADYAAPAGVRLSVTENGAAFDDVVEDGKIHDAERVAFVRAHLAAILDAIESGVPVESYFYWSFLDNYEWAWGYHKRFGIVRVDYDTQERTLKDSAIAYQEIIAQRSL
ncbi:GH1 family beta-glucosidase [Humidisolicoccus flavus]|uniref:GH1 family beta-glucosidase n=1 Tax=Humidisolicoccus flavus TaxID=3111414 RepID=UPI0032495E3E